MVLIHPQIDIDGGLIGVTASGVAWNDPRFSLVLHEIQRSSLICPFDWGKQTFLKLAAILWVGPCSTVPMKPPKVGSDIQDDQGVHRYQD